MTDCEMSIGLLGQKIIVGPMLSVTPRGFSPVLLCAPLGETV